MRSKSVIAPYVAISKTYLMRPLMWGGLMPLVIGCFILFGSSPRSMQFRDAFSTPFDRTGRHVCRDAAEFMKWSEDGSIHPEITALDFTRMGLLVSMHDIGSVSQRAEIRPFSDLQHTLSQFPNLETVQFDLNQFTQITPETLATLTRLKAVAISDAKITTDHVTALSQIASLRWITLETLDLPASLQPLSLLPHLTTLCLSNGRLSMTDAPAASPYRPEVLAELSALPKLRALILRPQYLPGIAYFAGNKTPNPACDSILKRSFIETFAGNRALERVWIGANQRADQREQLAAIARAMPHIDVRSATYDSEKIVRVHFVGLALGLVAMLLMLQLTSQFSAPAAQLIPRFAVVHLSWFGGLMAVAIVVYAFLVVRSDIIFLSGLAVFSGSVAAAATLQVLWNVVGMTGRNWANYVSAAIVVVVVYVPMLKDYFRPVVAANVDQFLMGMYPMLASLLLVLATLVVIACLSMFGQQHRVWAEHAIAPAMTVQQIGERRVSLAHRQWNDRKHTGRLSHWYRQLDGAAIAFWQGKHRSVAQMWQLGQSSAAIRRIMLLYTVIFCVGIFSRQSTPLSMVIIGLYYSVFMIVSMPLAMVAMRTCGRRETFSRDLLHPISRDRWIRGVFLAVLTQVGSLLGIALIIANLEIHFLLHTPTGFGVLRGLIALGALTVLGSGLILLIALHRGIGWVVLLGATGTFSSMLVTMVVVDTALGQVNPELRTIDNLMHHGSLLPAIWIVAILILVLAYKQWQDAEFARS